MCRRDRAPLLFVLAFALWLALCTASSTMLRSAWSYSFVLAGYTVAIIALPAIGKPHVVFDEAIARCTAICLGITCATPVSYTHLDVYKRQGSARGVVERGAGEPLRLIAQRRARWLRPQQRVS